MKRNIIVFFAILMGNLFAFAQRHEIGIQLGTSNLVGDIGKTKYLNPFPNNMNNISNDGLPFYAALMYRMNFNPYQSLRFRFAYNHVQFNDKYAQEYYRQNRGYSGTNSVYELSAIFDYNFLPVNDEQRSMLSPYIFGGLSGLFFSNTQITAVNDFNRDASGNAITPTSDQDFNTNFTYGKSATKFSVAIPFGVGLKYKFNYNWAIFGELMFRATFTDAIDYSKMDNSDVKKIYNRDANSTKSLLQTEPYLTVSDQRVEDYLKAREVGNINSKDWVNTISLGISYSFGRPACYCQDK
ncbi:DUF6089 family protein [Cloacibacterium sp.]|uniref:type IX secretion system protein PorG n=1 Tax=Cloacibacterium sp. TaxID=1913682 RepID=UPI0035B06B8A